VQVFERTVGAGDPRYREALVCYARMLREDKRREDAARIEARVNLLLP